MNSLKESIYIYGVNWYESIGRFVNPKELYYGCRCSFVKGSSFSAPEGFIQQKEYITAFDYAHTSNGIVGDLGLIPLCNSICNIVESIRNREYEELLQQYAAIIVETDRAKLILKGR